MNDCSISFKWYICIWIGGVPFTRILVLFLDSIFLNNVFYKDASLQYPTNPPCVVNTNLAITKWLNLFNAAIIVNKMYHLEYE